MDQHVPADQYDPHASHAPRTPRDEQPNDYTITHPNTNNPSTPDNHVTNADNRTTVSPDNAIPLDPIPHPDIVVCTTATGTDKTLKQNGEHIGASGVAQASASVLAIAEPVFQPKTDEELQGGDIPDSMSSGSSTVILLIPSMIAAHVER